MKRDDRWALALLILGSLQMVGDVLGVPALVGLGAASHVSPAPKVFTTIGDAEPFSASFALELEEEGGNVRHVPLDRAHYERLRGPYNRRNVVGAVVAGGPHLTDNAHVGPMMEAAARHALCGHAPILRELEGDRDRAPIVRATIVQTAEDGEETRWSVSCRS
ncbi:MAG: hypothetical protein JJ863_16825 [Deltaproteobacteria bacterium]|nr:hypothetical protein [Deltaproteobacteria bacterium]